VNFVLPNKQRFSIPDEWWNAAGMESFLTKRDAYRSYSDELVPELDVTAVPLCEIAPPPDEGRTRTDYGGFVRNRLLAIFDAFVCDIPLPPARAITENDGIYRYSLIDGYHRFYASCAAGFRNLPIVSGKGFF